jgi:type IV secretory pathway VirB4 component
MVGTPFADSRQPLIGVSEATAAPAYLSVWHRANHNALVLGSSGAGKSVAVKTLLVRHLMEGATAVVIDPDSEYRRVMHALGGTHLELGSDALNPLALPAGTPPDIAASIVLPVLSVMAGDDRGMRDGRPVRRLPDEDQGWLYGQVASFFRNAQQRAEEPLLHDLVAYIREHSAAQALTGHERDRLRIITARLARFTQGDRAAIFDRASTFSVRSGSVAIGLRNLAMTYAADLTPALAVVLSSVLALLRTGLPRLIVVVDEAHRVTADPDAGDVLGSLVRQARKYGAGVWMCSQRVEDFIATDLGRTLSATAATKLLMGVEEAALPEVRKVFDLRGEEVVALHPPLQGRGVLISGSERSVIRVLPGVAVLALSTTGQQAGTAVPA